MKEKEHKVFTNGVFKGNPTGFRNLLSGKVVPNIFNYISLANDIDERIKEEIKLQDKDFKDYDEYRFPGHAINLSISLIPNIVFYNLVADDKYCQTDFLNEFENFADKELLSSIHSFFQINTSGTKKITLVGNSFFESNFIIYCHSIWAMFEVSVSAIYEKKIKGKHFNISSKLEEVFKLIKQYYDRDIERDNKILRYLRISRNALMHSNGKSSETVEPFEFKGKLYEIKENTEHKLNYENKMLLYTELLKIYEAIIFSLFELEKQSK